MPTWHRRIHQKVYRHIKETHSSHRNDPFLIIYLQCQPQQIAKSWQKMKAQTASEPRNLNFAHYIAGSSYDPTISKTDAAIRSTAFELGLSPDLFQLALDVSILKKSGVFDISLMRTIILFNAAFDTNNKVFSYLLTSHAERNGSLVDEKMAAGNTDTLQKQLLRKFSFSIFYANYAKPDLARYLLINHCVK